jgi:S1-C subfamily serine protease
MGVTLIPASFLTADEREEWGIAKPVGLVLLTTLPGGPAAKAGLKPGDQVLRYGENDFATAGGLDPAAPASADQFQKALGLVVAATRPGVEVEVSYLRAGTPGTARLVPLAGDAMEELEAKAQEEEARTHGRLGFLLASAALLSPEDRSRFGVSVESGVVAVRVLPGSPAAAAGIRDGDLVTEVAGRKVPDAAALAGAGEVAAWAFERAVHAIYQGVGLDAAVPVSVEREGHLVTISARSISEVEYARLAEAAGWAEEEDEGDDDDSAEGDDDGEEGDDDESEEGDEDSEEGDDDESEDEDDGEDEDDDGMGDE